MIVFFSQSVEGHNLFSQYSPPTLRLLGPFSLFDYFRLYKVCPHVIPSNKKLKRWLQLNDITKTQLVFVNVSLVPSRSQVSKLISEMSSLSKKNNGDWVILSGKSIVAFSLSADEVEVYMKYSDITLEQIIYQKTSHSKKNKTNVIDEEYKMLEQLHQWVIESMKLLESDIGDYSKYWRLKKSRQYPGLWWEKGVNIHPSVDIIGNAPIMVHKGAQIGAFTCLEGPLIIKENSIVNPHSYIKHSLIGHTVKVGGEVSSSVISNYSNKAHYGYLGNSYVGEWVNIGAGTISSNLKNNYRTVKYLSQQGKKIDSRETFLGAFLGDFSKVGINTALSPGTIVGMGASVMGVVDGYIQDFVISDSGKKVGHIKLPTFIETHEKMFSRRDFYPDSEYWKCLKSIYQSSF